MIPSGVEVFVGLSPIDLRWGFDRLAGVVQERLGRMPRSGALFVFFGKRRTALKILFFDGSGLCLFYKRLDRGTFRVPQPHGADASSVELSERELDALLDAIDIDAGAVALRSRRVH
jgi:transposase